MILKLLVLAAIIWAVYFFFIKKKSITSSKSSSDKEEASSMVECETCSTYISVDDALISNGKYYCSKECIKA